MAKVHVIEEYLKGKLNELKEEEQILNHLIQNGHEEELVGELLDVLEKIVVISIRLEHCVSDV